MAIGLRAALQHRAFVRHAGVVRNQGHNEFEPTRWGLVPSWAQDPTIGQRMINARAETLLEKPSFKQLVSTRRCLIPADGFSEWRRDESPQGADVVSPQASNRPQFWHRKKSRVYDPNISAKSIAGKLAVGSVTP